MELNTPTSDKRSGPEHQLPAAQSFFKPWRGVTRIRGTRLRHVLAVTALTCVLSVASALPVVTGGYEIQQYATGVGAVAGMVIGPDGALYAADNAGGRIVRIASDGSVTVVATGIPFANGITFTSGGGLFAASGGGQAVYQVLGGSTSVFAGSGLSFPTSVAALGNELYVSNSGNGTISSIDPDGTVHLVLSGLSAPNGPFGISFGPSGTMYFIDHGTGGVYSYDFSSSPQLIGKVSGLGGTFTQTGFGGQLFVTDTVLGELLVLDGSGGASVFASGFSAKANPPYIGPNGIAHDGSVMFVGDGDTIYKITAVLTPAQLLAQLDDEVIGVGSGKSLANKIGLAQTYLAANDIGATCRALGDFVSEVNAQIGKKIEGALATKLVGDAAAIENALDCP